ncbi:MAG: peptidogalycan biosysnthesis protein, partial [Allorhizobium sp.]
MADEVTIRVVRSFTEIASAEWGELTGASRSAPGYNPFTSHAFLSSVEESGSATAETGWMGHHLLLEEEGRLIGAVPAYLKSHSQGEYVFDHGWADAFHRAGGRYYPKLQASIPFT